MFWDPCVLTGLQNDHQAIMKDIEEGLYKVHAAARDNKTTENEKPKQG